MTMKWTLNKSLVSITILGCLFTACQDRYGMEDVYPVEIQASIEDVTASKAPYTQTSPSTNAVLEAAVWASSTAKVYPHSPGVDGSEDGTVMIHTSAKFQSSSSQFIPGVYYKPEDDPSARKTLYFVAMHPAGGWTPDNGTNKEASFRFNGSQDVMFAPETSGVYKTQVPNLNFRHMLTQIRLKIDVADENGDGLPDDNIPPAWGNLLSINIESETGIKIDLGSEWSQEEENLPLNVQFSEKSTLNFYSTDRGSAQEEQIFPAANEGTPISANDNAVAYVLCAPVMASAEDAFAPGVLTNEYYLNIRSEHREVRLPIDLMEKQGTHFSGSTMGKQFTLKLKFKMGDNIAVSATVTDWVTGGIGVGKIKE